MNNRSMLLAGIVLATAAPAQRPAVGPPGMDVAGVRLRMTPAEAKTALATAGYRMQEPSMVDSFQQKVRREADARLGRPMAYPKSAGMSAIVAFGPKQERAEVIFAQTPAGSVVGGVTVDVPQTSITSLDFVAQAKAKYGSPGRIRFAGAEMTWCMPEVGTNCGLPFVASGPEPADYPQLETSSYRSGGRIRLTSGNRWHSDLDRQREAAVEALAPKARTVAF